MSNFPPPEQLIAFYEFAKDLARQAGAITHGYFGKAIEVERKADESPVTRADKDAEQAMRRLIVETYPEHRIIGEEFGESGEPESPWQWVLDPIDGTKSFIHGIPLYTNLVALLYANEPIIGVINNPETGELLAAGLGMGAWINNEPAKVSSIEQIADARFMHTDAGDLLRRIPESRKLFEQTKISRSWGDAYGYLLLATGRAELMIDPIMNLWDIACLLPIVREAGGEITDRFGNEDMGDSAVASNGLLHEEIMAILGNKGYHRHH